MATEEMLEEKTNRKNAMLPESMLYITTDKTLYLPTEVIWFTGYLLPYVQKKDTVVADMLSVALLSEKGDVVMRKTYAINKMICSGSLTLTDSIAPGNYQFIASTNLVNDKNQSVQHFSTPIIIRSTSASNSFVTHFDFREQKNTDTLVLSATLKRADGRLAVSTKPNKKNGSINYALPNKPIRTAYFDEFGKVSLSIPRKELTGSTGVLQTSTTFEGATKQFNLHSSMLTDNQLTIRFYPEGGDLVEDLMSRVSYEALFADGRPSTVKLQLLDNGVVKDTLTTDSAGAGVFVIIPKRNHVYSLRPIGTTNQASQKLYELPPALTKGMVLSLHNAVANDTLSVTIQSSVDSAVYLSIINLLSNDAQISPLINLSNANKIQIPLNNIYKGLNTLTILDSKGRPFAECVFFAHFNTKNSANIVLEKAAVGTNQKVEATIQLQDADNKPIGGMFTVACVRQNRLSGAYKTNIETYYHLNYSLPNNSVANLYKSRTDLEKVMRIQGWRRLSWQQLNETPQPKLNSVPYHKISLEGRVKPSDGSTKFKGPFTVMSKKDSLSIIFTTDQEGIFSPTPVELASKEGSARLLFAAYGVKGDGRKYIVEVKDPLDSLIRPTNFPFPNNRYDFEGQNLSHASEVLLTGEPFVRQLQTVEIKGKSSVYQTAGYGTNERGDYVCYLNFLNCYEHTPQTTVTSKPVIGKTYSYQPIFNTRKISYAPKKSQTITMIYQGCSPENMKGIYEAREFYAMEQLKKDSPEENFFLSTLYWNPMFKALSSANNKVSFNSSDAAGLYKISIEGIADNGDFIYAEKLITVQGK
ncbi:MAG: hypothetical protein EOO90_17420 [Pedobacter sp.]|nr:MAG: hypothetical protein EOO90_17420 [Pedobacter sp.]